MMGTSVRGNDSTAVTVARDRDREIGRVYRGTKVTSSYLGISITIALPEVKL